MVEDGSEVASASSTTLPGSTAAFDDDTAGLPEGMRKEVLRPAANDCWRCPASGDSVTVHYTGRLQAADGPQFDTSEGKLPVSFVLGSGEVIKGWEHALPTMREGEVARFFIPPQYAYGERGMPPTIPPRATLVFDIELVSWSSKDNLFGDWGCVRSTLQDGVGWKEVESGSEVEISLRAVASDSQVLEERRHLAYRLGSGKLGRLSEGVDMALLGMRRNAQLLLRCQKEYAYGKDSHGEVTVHLDLHEIYAEEDVSFAQDRSVIKKQIREAPSMDTPDDGAEVSLTVDSVVTEEGASVPGFVGPHALKLRLGDGDLCDALEQAVLKMTEGERAVVTCSCPSMCADSTLGIAAPSDFSGPVSFTLELTHFENPPAAYSLSSEEKVTRAQERKDMGSKLFSRGRYLLAEQRYKGVLELLFNTEKFSEELKEVARQLKLTCELNWAQCCLKLGDFFAARAACDAVLKEDPKNPKALFRRASAFLQVNDFESAAVDLRRLLEYEPENADAKRLLPKALHGLKQADKAAKSMYAKMSRAIGEKSMFQAVLPGGAGAC